MTPSTPCPIPGCPEESVPDPRDPRCTCGKPIWIALRPGEHIHPCPVHPERIMRGPNTHY